MPSFVLKCATVHGVQRMETYCINPTLCVCVCVQLERFRTDYDLGPAARAVDQAIEQTRVNIEWVKEHKDIVLNWFEDVIPRRV